MIRKYLDIWLLVILILAIKIFSLYPSLVERYYSIGFYQHISKFQRLILGWIPISMGDLLYAGAGLFLAYGIIKIGWRFRKRRIPREWILYSIRRIIRIALVIYAWFNISWGLNYNRIGIAGQLQLDTREPDSAEFFRLARDLSAELNALAPIAMDSVKKVQRKPVLFNGAIDAYDELDNNYPVFGYAYPSVKASMYSYLGNYLGFTGYYNPFTGEAQVNTTVPHFLRPFISCHEIGHQLGYAKEYEANLAAFLSASSSRDPVFRYSVFFEMYAYTRPYLRYIDSMALKQLDSSLHPVVKNDFRVLRRFLEEHENPVEEVVDIFYSQYLRLNEQPAGRFSYNQVVLLLTGYYRKYHWEIKKP